VEAKRIKRRGGGRRRLRLIDREVSQCPRNMVGWIEREGNRRGVWI